jgi:hypothetical protein
VGLGQVRHGSGTERPLITSGDDLCNLARLLPNPQATDYSARDVVEYLLTGVRHRCESLLSPTAANGH